MAQAQEHGVQKVPKELGLNASWVHIVNRNSWPRILWSSINSFFLGI